MSYLIIRALALMGLAWKVHLSAAEAMAAKRRRAVEERPGQELAVGSSVVVEAIA